MAAGEVADTYHVVLFLELIYVDYLISLANLIDEVSDFVVINVMLAIGANVALSFAEEMTLVYCTAFAHLVAYTALVWNTFTADND